MRIDSHQHFWHYNTTDYGWITDKLVSLKRNFLPDDLKPLLEAINFDGCIAVQARGTEAETDYLLGIAARNDFVKGVVGWVDLCAEDAPDRLGHFAQNPLLKGIRHILHDESDENYCLRSDFMRGIAALQPFRLTYDLLLRPQHLRPAITLVDHFPNQKFVLDHIAKPLIKDQVFDPWEKDIRELASYDHVWCKLSGMVTEADWNNWKATDIYPYLDIIYDAFGAERLMIGSDWGVCTLAGEYVPVMKVVIDYVKQFSTDIQDQILGSNCAAFYDVVVGD